MSTSNTNNQNTGTVRIAVLMPHDLRGRIADHAAREGLAVGPWIRMQLIRVMDRSERRDSRHEGGAR